MNADAIRALVDLDTRHSTLDTRHSTLDTRHSTLDTRPEEVTMNTEVTTYTAELGYWGHAGLGIPAFRSLVDELVSGKTADDEEFRGLVVGFDDTMDKHNGPSIHVVNIEDGEGRGVKIRYRRIVELTIW